MTLDTLNNMVENAAETATDLRASTAQADGYRDVVSGKVQQARGRLQEAKGALTDSNSDRFQGRRDQLIGIVQEKYGYTRIQAADFINDFVNEAMTAQQQAQEQAQATAFDEDDSFVKSKAVWAGLALLTAGGVLLWRSRRTSDS